MKVKHCTMKLIRNQMLTHTVIYTKEQYYWKTGPDYTVSVVGTTRKMSVDIDATTDLLLLIRQKLRIVQYWYGSLSIRQTQRERERERDRGREREWQRCSKNTDIYSLLHTDVSVRACTSCRPFLITSKSCWILLLSTVSYRKYLF